MLLQVVEHRVVEGGVAQREHSVIDSEFGIYTLRLSGRDHVRRVFPFTMGDLWLVVRKRLEGPSRMVAQSDVGLAAAGVSRFMTLFSSSVMIDQKWPMETKKR
jgi:hypothetical protein